MVSAFDVGLFVFFFPGAVWYGYQSAKSAALRRSLAGADPTESAGFVDGEPATVQGEVSVSEPADASERALDEGTPPVGAFLWRATFVNKGKNAIDFENWTIEQVKATFASGIEAGAFTVGDRSARIDPGWLVEAHDATALSELELGGISRSKTFHTYLWDSPYVHLTGDTNEVTCDRLRGVVQRHNDGVDLDDYFLESRPVRQGDTLTVHGEVRVEDGDPVLGGSDATPLVVSDEGIDGVRNVLRGRTLRCAAYAAVLLVIAGQFAIVDVATHVL